MKTATEYRQQMIDDVEKKRRAVKSLTWGEVWDIQEEIIKGAMLDAEREAVKEFVKGLKSGLRPYVLSQQQWRLILDLANLIEEDLK